jgi:hypothetical protein
LETPAQHRAIASAPAIGDHVVFQIAQDGMPS